MEMTDRAVLFKPPGWEVPCSTRGECKGAAAALTWQVYDGNLPTRQLRVFAQAGASDQ